MKGFLILILSYAKEEEREKRKREGKRRREMAPKAATAATSGSLRPPPERGRRGIDQEREAETEKQRPIIDRDKVVHVDANGPQDHLGPPPQKENIPRPSSWVKDLTADGDIEPNPGWDEGSDSQSDKALGNNAPVSTPLSLRELALSLTPASMPPLEALSEVSDLGLSDIPLNSYAPSEAASVPSDGTLASLEDLEGIELGDGMYGGGGYWERDAVNDFERARGSARGYI
uniref:Uncharacterized protein n=1 Tax=Chromera velia CCMP2878 TaxID=1169474 RepID=A0A0G4GVI0_9ALVE|eukprot:Cvel_23512.t1-p1 / transcript=Cvel_23512.t1 / gene=Cvel_23512 / organism=Chromera_velia_CCMP2878 / gene_product=hypothetical protein / transcript_product=hypothetical protein / location=Cvel_scaffold2431:4936-12381(+) / protein_length=230 / sequence_SO=supercontig / SO=protein_coding / is_pseudo=false